MIRTYLISSGHRLPEDETYAAMQTWLCWYKGFVADFHRYWVYTGGTKRRTGIGREEGATRSCGKQHDLACFKSLFGLTGSEEIGDFVHLNGRHDRSLDTHLNKSVRNAQTVDNGGQHTHTVGSITVHIARGTSSPEVAAADNYTDLNTVFNNGLDTLTNGFDHRKINTCFLLTCEHLARKLQKNSIKCRFEFVYK